MPNSVNRQRPRRYAIPLGLLPVALACLPLGGCGAATKTRIDAPPLASESSRAVLSAAELASARRAGLAFAKSYIASTRHSNVVTVHGATTDLSRQLRANAARFPVARSRAPLRLLALILTPRSKARIDATMSLAPAREPSFPIWFVLGRHGGRWLAASLNGTAAR
jgi:hypothetical protein